MPKVLAELGHKLNGAADSVALDEAITSLDHVRKAAFTYNSAAMDMKPPVLLADNLEPAGFFVYNEKTGYHEESFKKGSPHLFRIPDLSVVGGLMMHTQHCCFPVVVLHSPTENVLLVYCPRAPIAALEAELYDSAFAAPDSLTWEKTVLQDEASEILQWRREAAIATRDIGHDNIPKFMCGDDDLYVTRLGVIPYLSLRAFENEGEYAMVHKAVARMMRILPIATDTKPDIWSGKPVMMVTVFLSGDFVCPAEVKEQTPTKQDVEEVCAFPVLTHMAHAILRYGDDGASDNEGRPISECNTALPWHPEQKIKVQAETEKEVQMQKAARIVKMSDAWYPINCDDSYSLPVIMRGMNRSYITQQILDGDAVKAAGDNMVRAAIEAVALASFKAEDVDFAIESCGNVSESNMTIFTAVSKFANCLVDRQAIMIASRDQDGRFGQVRLIGSTDSIAQVNRQNFARLACLAPWVTTFIIDKGNVVSKLCVNDPVEVREYGSKNSSPPPFAHQKLEIREDASRQTVRAADSQIAKLIEQNAKLEKTATETARKIDVLLNRVLEEPIPSSLPPPVALPAQFVDQEEDEVVQSFKRSLASIEMLHKRMKKK